jgi:tetratricopeptide (TPR) repeat protein
MLPMSIKKFDKPLYIALIVALLTVILYLPAIQNDFVNWDDDLNIYENPYIQSLDFKLLRYMFSFKDTMWIPLTRFSHALNYAVWGLDPTGHHLTNIVFHGLNTFLVVILVIRLIENSKFAQLSSASDDRKIFLRTSLIASGLTGILFGIHPLRVESVVWITERKDVLSGFFVLLSLLYYLKFCQNSFNKKSKTYYVLSIVFFAMALMSKPAVVTLPIILILLDIYPLERLTYGPAITFQLKVVAEKIPYFVLSLVLSVVTILSYHHEGLAVAESNVIFSDRLLVAARSLCFYLFKMVYPVNLAPFYPYPANVSFLTMEYIGVLILVLGVTAFSFFLWKKQKILAAVWIYFVVTLVPVLGIIKFGAFAAADRYTYLPSLGPFLLAGVGTAWAINITIKRSRRLILIKLSAIIIMTIIVFILFCSLTLKQIKVWKDSMTLWNSELEIYPERAFPAYHNRGLLYQAMGRYDQAIADYNKAIEINPRYINSYRNRGLIYRARGQYDRAIADYSKAIEIDPGFHKAYNNRGNIYTIKGEYDRAIADYTKAIEINPRFDKAYSNRGIVFTIKGEYDRAVDDYTKAVEINPNLDMAYNNRGVNYLRMSEFREAEKDIKRALTLNPDNLTAYVSMAEFYSLINENDDACKWLTTAIDKGFNDFRYIKTYKSFENMRNLSCYQELIRRNQFTR